MNVEHIDTENITEEEYLNKAIEKIGQVTKTANKTLTKDCFIKVFKYTGDYAKIKAKDTKTKAQAKRSAQFGGDAKSICKL